MGLFNIFGKSTEQKVIEKLNDNNLDTMARLLNEAKIVRYMSYSQDQKIAECNMLKEKFDLKKGPANESLNRFKWAKDICEEYNFSKGAKFMQNYIDIYNIYLNNYWILNKIMTFNYV